MLKRILTAAALCVLALAGTPAPVRASAAPALTTFYFRGQCEDCSGFGYGTLVVQDYTLGTSFNPSEFVTVPEPLSASALAVCLLGTALLRRGRRARDPLSS